MVIPNKVEQNRRPTRQQQHEPKECIIAKALGGNRKGPQGKPDSLGVECRQSRLKPTVMTGPQDRPISTVTATNDSAAGVRPIPEGNSSQGEVRSSTDVRSSILGA